jgi:glycosyltransferase involved in cell wall biosynthesis
VLSVVRLLVHDMHDSVLIDISRVVSRASRGRLPTGVDRVCLAYIESYIDRAQAVLQWGAWRRIAPVRESRELFELLLRPGPHFRRDTAKVIARGCLPPWPSQDAKGRIYFNIGHSRLDDVDLGRWLERTHQRPVYLVHDLIPVTHPEYCRPGDAKRHTARMETALRTAAGLVAISQDTLDVLKGFAAERKLIMPPVTVAPIAPAALRFDRSLPPPLPQPYFVVVGTIEPRKNHLLLLHLWRDLVAEYGANAPHLVIVGQRGWECENVVDLLERCASLRGFVHEKSSCTDAELAQYLGHARALLFPSFAEGYGMPLVEALMFGTPAIASTLPAFREAAAGVPDYLHPLDGAAWAQAVRDYAHQDSPRRDAQLRRLAAFRMPLWDDHFKRVEALLETLR